MNVLQQQSVLPISTVIFIRLMFAQHTITTQIEMFNKRIKIYEIKQLLLQGFEKPRDIVNKVFRGADEETILAMGKQESLHRFIRNFRMELKNPKPYVFHDLKLSANLAFTCKGEPFYIYGAGNFGSAEVCDEFLIFFSDLMMSKLNGNRIWAVDGTFKVVPSP
jgi:hypothetical protein